MERVTEAAMKAACVTQFGTATVGSNVRPVSVGFDDTNAIASGLTSREGVAEGNEAVADVTDSQQG
jgi:hypothetical protein